ncbi:MAG: hypothetical protein J6X33_01500 [Clostridiales bacterium]|nr:hypothetical protein [Clostridiales bacterium]
MIAGGTGFDNGLSGTYSSKCAGCAGNLTYDTSIGALVCHQCGKVYDSQSMEETGSFGLAFREKEYAEGEPVDTEDLDKVEYVCDSCGAQIITDKRTTATFCSFCGSPTLISRRLTRQFKPDMIIPFKIDKERAMDLYDEFVSSAKSVPKDFRSAKVRERLSGIYMPVWLVGADCITDVTASGKRKDGDMVYSHDLSRVISYSLADVPFTGSGKMSQRLLEAVEPFDLTEAVEFNTSLLQGFYAYKYDNLPERMIDKIEERFNIYGEEFGKNGFDGLYEVRSDNYITALRRVNVRYCMVPVWFMCYEYEGLYYHFVINGQTGEVCGRLPEKDSFFARIVKKAGKFTPALVSAGVAVLLMFPAWLFLRELYPEDPELFWMYLLITLSVIFGASFIIVYKFAYISYVRRQLAKESEKNPHELDRRPPVEQYLVYDGKIEMENRDRFGAAMKVTGDMNNRNYHFF